MASKVHYIIIEKQYSQDLAVEYSSETLALAAMNDSLFIDAECQEDCLECYVTDTLPEDVEHIIAPEKEGN